VFYTCKIENKAVLDSANVFKSWSVFLERRGIKFSEVVAGQMLHETYFFTSSVYKNCHNPFGMKMNGRGLAKGVCEGHAYYNTVLDAIEDYRLYQARMLYLAKKQGRPCVTNDDYFELLCDLPHLRGHRYAEDLDYVKKVKARMVYTKNL